MVDVSTYIPHHQGILSGLQSEARIHELLTNLGRCANILRFRAASQRRSDLMYPRSWREIFYLYTEYAAGGDLDTVMKMHFHHNKSVYSQNPFFACLHSWITHGTQQTYSGTLPVVRLKMSDRGFAGPGNGQML